jgi:hypothetical protein
MHLGPVCGLLCAVTDTELATALRRCRHRLYAVAALLVAVPVLLSVLVVALH